METLTVLVVAPGITHFFHCLHCEQLFGQTGIGETLRREEFAQYPEDLKVEVARLARWLDDLGTQFKNRVHFQVVDPQSMLGMWLSLRYWIRRYPTFIIPKHTKIVGWDKDELYRAIEKSLVEFPF